MMMFSATTLSFYSSDLNKSIPDDAVQISDALYASMMAAVSAGCLIGAENGMPVSVPFSGIPSIVSRYQARAALFSAGLLDEVESIMADPATDRLTVIAWQDAQTFRRDSPVVAGLAAQLGLTDAQVDDLFTQASQIQ